jgi:prepilin-type N-terminal cleavage/methylation domain-containing protein
MRKARDGFTLIEVLIAVVIISTVIMALIQMFANNTHIFSNLTKRTAINQYGSFFIANPEIGLEDDKMKLYDFVDDFNVEDKLRRQLKDIKAEVIYQELEKIDMADYDGSKDVTEEDTQEEAQEKEDSSSQMVFEIGKSVLKVKDSSVSLLRLRLQ